VDRQSYVVNSYPRTAVALRSLPAVVGHERFLRAMRNYSETWRYRHPYPQDFFDSFTASCGEDLSWYFDEVFGGTGTIDWSVEVEQFQRDDLPSPCPSKA
jgi:aminopeptidase N